MDVAELRSLYTASTADFDAKSAKVQAKLLELEALANRSTSNLNRSATQGSAAVVAEANRVSQAIISSNGNRIKSAEAAAASVIQSNGKIVGSELSMTRQLAAVASLQRQRSAALISDWKKSETAARNAAQGILPLLPSLRNVSAEMLATRNAVRILGHEIGEVLPGHLGHAVNQMAYLDSSASAVGEAFGLLATPIGASVAVVAGIGVTAAASAGVLYEMATSAAKTGNELLAMSQKTGLSVETIQALDEASKVTGSSLERIIQSVGIFEKKLAGADIETGRLAQGFKKLHIDTSDANKALGQVIEFLGKFPAGVERTGIAMTIFGRAGKDFAAITDEMKGNLVDYTDELKKMGEILGKDDLTAMREFTREQVKMERQWEVLKFKIEAAATPIVEEWLKGISEWMVRNQSEILDWGKSFVDVASAIVTHTGYILKGLKEVISLSPIEIEIIETVRRVFDQAEAADTSNRGQFSKSTSLTPTFGVHPNVPLGMSNRETSRRVIDMIATSTAGVMGSSVNPPANPFGGRGSGGRRGEDSAEVARRIAQITLQETTKGFQAEQDALDRKFARELLAQSDFATQSFQINLDMHNASLAGLDDELAKAQLKRKGSVVAVAEVNAKIEDENRRFLKEDQKILDNDEDYRINTAKIVGEGLLRIHQITNEQHKARFADLAQFQLTTEADAAEKSKQEDLKIFVEREKNLRVDLDRKREGSNEYRQINQQLGALEAERAAFTEDADRKIAEARIRDIQNLQQYHDQLQGIYLDVSDAAQQAAEATISPLRGNQFARNQVIEFDRQLDRLRESERAQEAVRRLSNQRELNELERHHAELVSLDLSLTEQERQTASNRADQLLSISQGLDKQIESQHELTAARLAEIDARAAQARKQQLREVADDLAQITSDVFDNLGKGWDGFWKGLAQTATDNLKRIGAEILQGFSEKLIVGDTKGSTAGGLVGGMANKVLGLFGIKKPEIPGLDLQAASLGDNTTATADNTAAIRQLTIAMNGIPGLGGGGQTAGLISSLIGSFIGGGKGALAFGGVGGGVEGKALASGMDYVPYDGFKAVLHRGERVVPRMHNHTNISDQIYKMGDDGGGMFLKNEQSPTNITFRAIIVDSDQQARNYQASSETTFRMNAKRNKEFIKTLMKT